MSLSRALKEKKMNGKRLKHIRDVSRETKRWITREETDSRVYESHVPPEAMPRLQVFVVPRTIAR